MSDARIRAALHSYLRPLHGSAALYLDELGICGTVRADVAVIDASSFSGFEIKSDLDTLRRLPTQVEYYSAVFDYAHLVVGEHHHDKAVALLPPGWGVIIARDGGSGSLLEVEREATWNAGIRPEALVQLLWREEMLAELAALGADRGVRSKSRNVIAARLTAEVGVDELRNVVRTQLLRRPDWR